LLNAFSAPENVLQGGGWQTIPPWTFTTPNMTDDGNNTFITIVFYEDGMHDILGK
jgi:hypothetical protein